MQFTFVKANKPSFNVQKSFDIDNKHIRNNILTLETILHQVFVMFQLPLAEKSVLDKRTFANRSMIYKRAIIH